MPIRDFIEKDRLTKKFTCNFCRTEFEKMTGTKTKCVSCPRCGNLKSLK